MRIAVLGIGVIGTTYAYAFQKAGHDTFHILREGKKDIPAEIGIRLLFLDIGCTDAADESARLQRNPADQSRTVSSQHDHPAGCKSPVYTMDDRFLFRLLSLLVHSLLDHVKASPERFGPVLLLQLDGKIDLSAVFYHSSHYDEPPADHWRHPTEPDLPFFILGRSSG